MNSLCTSEFQARLRMLARYSEAVEGFLAQQAQTLEAEVERGMAARPPAERKDYFEAYLDDILEVSNDLPSLLRLSLLTTLDSSLEHMLTEICAAYAEMLSLESTRRDFSGSPLDRSKTYLKKVVGIPFPDQAPEWTSILRLRDLRNAIVHVDGTVSGSASVLRKWIPQAPGLTLQSDGRVSVGESFIGHALDLYTRFSDKVDAALASKPLTGFQAGFDAVE